MWNADMAAFNVMKIFTTNLWQTLPGITAESNKFEKKKLNKDF